MNILKYSKANKYQALLNEYIMGPNSLKFEEELLQHHQIPEHAIVMDLGCGKGLTSTFLAKEYGFWTFAVDLWISATENKRFSDTLGLTV